MKKKAGKILLLLKQNLSSLPALILLITFLFTSYLLYPQNASQPEVAGISDSKLPSKSIPTTKPTPSIHNYKTSQSSAKSIPTATPSSTINNNETTTNNTSSNTNTPATVPPTNNTDSQNIPTPTAVPEPTDTPIPDSIFPTIIPSTTPADNGDNSTVNNTVGTILGQIVPLLNSNQ